MKKLLSAILSIAIFISTATVAFAEATSQKEKITVGICADFKPFEYIENNEFKGFDIELINIISERTGYDIEFVNMDFDKLINSVSEGKVDCAISMITITEEREKHIDYSVPYLGEIGTDPDGAYENKYAIVFPNNTELKSKVALAAGEPILYNHINNSLISLIEDKTIEKLIKKYELEKNGEFYVPDVKKEEISYSLPSDWANSDIISAGNIGITEQTYYNYQSSITREEFCELTYNFITAVNPEIKVDTEDVFKDTDNKKVLTLNGLGIINGKTKDIFAPDDFLTREEAATILTRMINKMFPMEATELWFEYDDLKEISTWASDSVQLISNLGFMNGVGNNNFAPKSTYTVEQAIVTLVRIYNRAKASGLFKTKEKIYLEEVLKTTTEVDNFYINEALKLICESGKLASDKEYIAYYTSSEDMTEDILKLGSTDYSTPAAVYYLEADFKKISENLKAMLGEEAETMDFEKLLKLNKINLSIIPTLINASYGSNNLAALTPLMNSRGYIMPDTFKNNFALFFEYDGEYSAFVVFSEYGDKVISANMSFIKNGEKDNVARRVKEIEEGLGKGCIKFTGVKEVN